MTKEHNSVEAVLAYHRRSKHHLSHYAASLGYLDWDTQPDPFRTFVGAERVELPLLADRLDAAYPDLYSPGAVPPMPMERNSVAMLFELALGLSAWKQYKGSRWALRCNPSSGNLHPTEGYAILPEMPGLYAGVYHYVSRDHTLERRCVLEGRAAQQLAGSLPPASFLVGLSSIHWREAWKYGERAFRYCQHDAGHAIATVRYAAAALGWSARLIAGVSDTAIAAVLGLAQPESFSGIAEEDREHPDAILLVGPFHPPGNGEESEWVDIAKLRDVLDAGAWAGRANSLSPAHVQWPAIDVAAEATWQEDGATGTRGRGEAVIIDKVAAWLDRPVISSQVNAARLMKQRRSCLALDGITSISAETFYAMLDRLLPRPGVPPWDVWPWPPHLHCGIFVHRVRGVPSGLYLFERSPTVHERLRAALRADFLWKRPEGCPEYLPLFNLVEGDFRTQAEVVSCHQEIAAAGAFSLGMIADFGESIRATGAWWYRKLFWESGLLGQVLYLEAEAAGVRGTGIGCYFDDAFHNLLSLRGDCFQSLYHFTVGGPVDDPRLMTLSAYFHLECGGGPGEPLG
ncbi:MAG: SagB/ThcOx family dehydrogenase [candidate division NC10 bacterium]|jgi:SagB-type dehydrogenase family enzyme|nr:SagB/ThcOx family dehydrogenase [candidate division NC10 bacterium]